MTPSPFSFGVRILAGGAALLFLFLAVGVALPGTWSAERTAVMDSSPDAVYALLETPGSWGAWTAWPEAGLEVEGPERGVGARLRWDDPELGDGTFEIVEATPVHTVGYEVEVQQGSMRTRGVLSLAAEGTGTRVTWREEGDFGWNPLMGYWARFMERVQGRELEKALERLESAARATPKGAAPETDTASGGA